MAETLSNMLPLGTIAPDFKLYDTVSEMDASLGELKGFYGTVVMFICNHCPFVIHLNKAISTLAKEYVSKGVNCIAISSNDVVNYPQDGPQLMKENVIENEFIFPYLYDETQEVAEAYAAACTPDFYLFNTKLELVYRGQFDDSRPGNQKPITGDDLKSAIDALLYKKEMLVEQKPSIGCGIKWK